MKLAFYAPMKSPRHPVPSGDRRMGRLLWRALEQAGFDPILASEHRSFNKTGDSVYYLNSQKAGTTEANRLVETWSASPLEAPKGWFTYHVYHKAPDWIGPEVCRQLDIPYFIAEASHAPKRSNGPWQFGYEAAETAIRFADRVFHMTALDGACLQPLLTDPGRLVFLPPFLDKDAFFNDANASFDAPARIKAAGGQSGKLNLLSVAMMRDGDKLASYKQLSRALAHLKTRDWQLLIIGDGDQRSAIESLMSPFGDKIVYLGVVDPTDLPAFYKAVDLYVWPAHGEAYGMAFLEAAACGLPVVAGNVRGVPDVVKNGETGLLTAEGDMNAFAAAIDQLLKDSSSRVRMSEAARQFIENERDLTPAADLLKKNIEAVF